MFDLNTAKQRAEEYLKGGDYSAALASFISDLNKIEGRDYSGIQRFAGMLMMSGHLSTTEKVREFIQGTN
jgi:hypothetical protein